MSKAKSKGGKPAADSASWDEALVNEPVHNDGWSAHLVFVAPGCAAAVEDARLLAGAADGGNRKKFVVVEREQLLQTAREDAKLAAAASSGGGGKKSKAGTTAAPTQRPLHVEVCERVVGALAEGGGEVAPALLARLLKYRILKQRTEEFAARDALKKEAEGVPTKPAGGGAEGKKKGGGASGRTSKVAKKAGKETPQPLRLALREPPVIFQCQH